MKTSKKNKVSKVSVGAVKSVKSRAKKVVKSAKKAVKKNSVKKNPVPKSSVLKLQEAAELFEKFTGHSAKEYVEVDVKWPDVVVTVGKCTGIMYETVRDGVVEEYLHEFKKSARPYLVASHDGSMIALVLGHYNFTERGIVDKK